ncbi:MAG: hypothetical protein CSA65_02540 [Proteobacteria bacterium]|nr:MAG: hypothetical protein CSA65_02540 [Pseudomonadota bacterium]
MTVTKLIDTLLLLALPASGKSEVRTYMASLTPQQCREELGLGPTVQLDDYPYVHLMRRIDEELAALSQPTIFFAAQDKPFFDGTNWGTLIQLVNEDYDDLHSGAIADPPSAAAHLLDRLAAAQAKVGAKPVVAELSKEARAGLVERLEKECAAQLAEKHANYPDTLEGKTIVIEFARGGPDGSSMPLPAPYGYAYSLSTLSETILSRSAVLYVWVTPEESRRKNDERARPDEQGSILHHGVPIDVMLGDYGCDDMAYLLEQSGKDDTIVIERDGKRFELKVGRFDNRVDLTSFVRDEPEQWAEDDKAKLHAGLSSACLALAAS